MYYITRQCVGQGARGKVLYTYSTCTCSCVCYICVTIKVGHFTRRVGLASVYVVSNMSATSCLLPDLRPLPGVCEM